jgi:glyoxylase-like metal-dependent hydrolase (beta-lactamase superfamily II)
VLFAGDLVMLMNGQLRPTAALLNSNTDQLRESIRMMASYSFRWICPAHGSPVERGDLWEKILK